MTGQYDYAVPVMLATSADYATWTGAAAPAGIEAKLRSCTSLVLDAVQGAYYDVDTTGVATNENVRNAMRDATCIQAAAWVALKIDPAAGGVQQQTVRRAKRLGTASVEYADADAAAMARAAAQTGLVPEAESMLRRYNLISTEAYQRG